jgi:hypothetical protein
MMTIKTRWIVTTAAAALAPVGTGSGVGVVRSSADKRLDDPSFATTARRADMRRQILVLGVAATALLVAVSAAAACHKETPSAGPTPPTSAAPAPTSAAPIPAGSAAPVTGVYSPTIDAGAFSATVDNPFFPLRPGMRWDFRSVTPDGVETTVVIVTNNTKTIMGIPCVEVRDTVKLNGQLKEDTLDWYAQHRDGTVWYFGEDTKEYENGKVSSTKGTWTAGVNGAQPGIIMPAQPQIGDRYRQEYYKGDAEDLAEVLSVTEKATVPTGSYDGVLKTKETTPLEPDLLENKYYARGVGPVLTVDIKAGGERDELVKFIG